MRSWQSKKKEIQSLTETEKSELSIARFERCGAMPRLDTFAKISNCVGLRLALVENP